MSILYTVALVEDSLGYLSTLNWHINTDPKPGDEDYQLNRREIIQEKFDFYGSCRCLFFMQTRDRSAYLQYRIKCECAELRNLVEHHNSLLTYHNGSPILNEVYGLCCETQKTCIEHIGKLVSHLFVRNNSSRCKSAPREVTDELALQCYELICKQDEAKRAYEKMDKKLNRKYYMSQVNAYC